MCAKKQVEPYGIKRLHIEKFRAMHDLDVDLGKRVTVIAGQNRTGKSTLLGMLGQPFGLRDEKTIFGKTFSTKFTDIFNMSPEHDVPGEHLYYIEFNDDSICGKQEQPLQVKSFKRPDGDKSHIRIVAGASRNKGEGNIDYPVIYLGLKRTNPVGELANPQADVANLSLDELVQFKEWYSCVMSDLDDSVDVMRMSRRGQKETLLVNTGTYDYLANSAGQDNLGQIIGSLISFQRLKSLQGDEYKGGLLLVDEFDATLFPSSQNALLDLMYDVSPKLSLQVVFTTHSISLVEEALAWARKKPGEVNVVYLKSRESGVKGSLNPSMDDIECDLLVKTLPASKDCKVEVWCEDDEAKWVLGQILPSRLKKKCHLVSTKLGCGVLGELATRSIPSLEDVLFVVDADANAGASKKILECERRFVLPGGGKSPEESIYDMLLQLSDEDEFWENERHYTKQVMVSRRKALEQSFKRDGGKKDRRLNKRWFQKEKRGRYWGENGVKVAKLWKEVHREEIDEFCVRLEKRVDAILKRCTSKKKSAV